MNPKKIIEAVCEQYGITVEELLGTKRNEWFVRARKEAAFLMKDQLGLGPGSIGFFLKKDHSCVSYYLKKP